MSNLPTEIAAAPKAESRNSPAFSPEFDLLFAAARTAPDEARIDALAHAGIDWSGLLELAGAHGVRPLVYKSLRETCWRRIPAETRAAWDEAHQSLTGKALFLTGELLRVAAAFERAGTRIAALKGPVIAQMAYGDFTLREFSDLDLLVTEADFPRAVELISRLGYEPFWECEPHTVLRFLRHVGEYKLGNGAGLADIDLHWRVATKATALSPGIGDFPSGFQPLAIAGSVVHTLAPQDLPLYLAAQGGWDRWGDLRRICDLAEFLRRFPDVDWGPHFETARRLGGLRSMLAGLALARDLLGAALPASAEDLMRADPTVARLASKTARDLQRRADAGDAVSRYWFQLRAKRGLWGKAALLASILADRTTEDGSWLMLPRPLWWAYGVLRPLRMATKLAGRVR